MLHRHIHSHLQLTMPRKRKKRSTAPVVSWGLEATRPDAGGLLGWPTLHPRTEVTGSDRVQLYRAARALVYNSASIRAAVETCVNLQGWLLPQPATPDDEWNREARRHFMRAAMNPRLFDQAGALNFITAQLWLEFHRLVDGDAFIVATEWRGFPCFRFYRAPQVSSDGYGGGNDMGVAINKAGRPISYSVYDYATGGVSTVPAWAGYLYRHNPDPGMPRGVTDLVGGIVAARDLMELGGYLKASAKLSAAIGLVETKSPTDKKAGAMQNFGRTEQVPAAMPAEQQQTITQMLGGSKIISLEPGRDVKVLTDNRPGPNTLSFMERVRDELADGVGLSAGILFDSSKLGSAGIRMEMEKARRWVEKRHHWRKPLLSWLWTYWVAKEIAAGRLRAPREGSFEDVFWVPCRDMTIDIGRVATASINLVREGLMSPASFTLATEGRLPEDIARERARLMAAYRELEGEYNLPAGSLRQSALGATDTGIAIEEEEESDKNTPKVDNENGNK